ncbi:enoyl-CoA hydratase/isomerase family protein [Castellaniella sp.]|uniref:enoyl-CoA hydratase/isomerase family protein n=1 Tax=Castellaniella sp. TaxID=1955812 RepID=UPI003560F32E
MRLGELQYIDVSIADRIATVTLQRPDMLNAVGARMHYELSQVFRLLEADPACDVVVLTGAGRAFCAGGDLEWLQSMVEEPARFDAIMDEAKAIICSMLDMGKPMVCRMNGDAIGLGASLALCCDIIIANETARFGDTHVRVGLVAGDGAAVVLPYLVGYMRAKEMLLTGQLLSAQEGHQMGLINHVVPEDELDARVALIVGRLVKGARQAIRYTKLALNARLRSDAQGMMGMLMAYEALSSRSADHAEAVAAIRARRKPEFTGN